MRSVHHIERKPLCRDCLRHGEAAARCAACGSPRLIDLAEAEGLAIAHIDCDAFYASIEQRDDPSLRAAPLIIGGLGPRSVVSTCCYSARICGVRSAMPMIQALKLCPQAIVVPPNMAKYSEVGRQLRERMRALTPLVEPLSIDEAFLDLSGCDGVHGAGAAETLARFARDVERALGISVSVGLSYCKFVAKFASDLDKPRGFSIVSRDKAAARLAPQPIGRLWGVGRVAQARLEKQGFHIIGDLQALDDAQLLQRLGPEGLRLGRLARGVDERKVSIVRETKSISSETTFDVDIADGAELARSLLAQCERVAERLKKQRLAARNVTLKLRTADFRLRTRARTIPEPTQLATRLFRAARPLLEKEASSAPFRLIGVAAADFSPAETADRGDLADQDAGREKARESAIDTLREKFGRDAVRRGLGFVAETARRR